MTGGFEHLYDEPVYEGFIISVQKSHFRAPDGTQFERDVVRHPGAVSVVPITDDGDVILVSQYRAPFDRFMIEIPAGKRDVPDEPPEECARRELKEEIGVTAASLEELVVFHNSVGFSDEEGTIFLATGLDQGERSVDGLEERYMDTLRMPLSDALEMIAAQQITDAKTVLGLTLASLRFPSADSHGEAS